MPDHGYIQTYFTDVLQIPSQIAVKRKFNFPVSLLTPQGNISLSSGLRQFNEHNRPQFYLRSLHNLPLALRPTDLTNCMLLLTTRLHQNQLHVCGLTMYFSMVATPPDRIPTSTFPMCFKVAPLFNTAHLCLTLYTFV
jgi:hypothetical protein